MKNWKILRQNPIVTLAACVVLAAVLTGALAMLGAKLVDKGMLKMQWRIVIAYVIIGICAFASCYVTVKQVQKFRLLFCFGTAGLYFLLLLIGNSLLLKAAFVRMLPTAGVICTAALICALLGTKRAKRRY